LAYEMRGDGMLSDGRVFFDATAWTKTKPGVPDGIKVDRDGHLFAAGPGGIHIFTPDGRHIGSIEIGGLTSNVTWGDDGSVLYITADKTVYRMRLTTKGVGF
jgi:gluconolactonase